MDMTAHTSGDAGTALSQAETMMGEPEWQQPPLLGTQAPARPRARARSGRPEHLRQVGLVGIAQARAALAEASKKARHSSEHRAA